MPRSPKRHTKSSIIAKTAFACYFQSRQITSYAASSFATLHLSHLMTVKGEARVRSISTSFWMTSFLHATRAALLCRLCRKRQVGLGLDSTAALASRIPHNQRYLNHSHRQSKQVGANDQWITQHHSINGPNGCSHNSHH